MFMLIGNGHRFAQSRACLVLMVVGGDVRDNSNYLSYNIHVNVHVLNESNGVDRQQEYMHMFFSSRSTEWNRAKGHADRFPSG